jgi:hypothetical protein
MSYNYTAEKANLFTPEGIKRVIKIRDMVNSHLKISGAFRMQELGIASWEDMAVVDFMVEEGELVEFSRNCWGQYRVFTSPQVHNY